MGCDGKEGRTNERTNERTNGKQRTFPQPGPGYSRTGLDCVGNPSARSVPFVIFLSVSPTIVPPGGILVLWLELGGGVGQSAFGKREGCETLSLPRCEDEEAFPWLWEAEVQEVEDLPANAEAKLCEHLDHRVEPFQVVDAPSQSKGFLHGYDARRRLPDQGLRSQERGFVLFVIGKGSIVVRGKPLTGGR